MQRGKLVTILAISLMFMFHLGCGGGGGSSTSSPYTPIDYGDISSDGGQTSAAADDVVQTTRLKMTLIDAPVDNAEAVYVTIKEVSVHYLGAQEQEQNGQMGDQRCQSGQAVAVGAQIDDGGDGFRLDAEAVRFQRLNHDIGGGRSWWRDT